MPAPRRMMMAAAGVTTTYRYFLLDVTDNDGGTAICLSHIKIMVGDTDYPTQTATSNTLPSPLVMSADSDQAGQEAFRAFDNDGATFWQNQDPATTGWIKIDLGAGNGIGGITALKLTARPGVPNRSPQDFTLEGSDTGSFSGEEEVLITATGSTGWGSSEERTFTV